MSKDIEQLILNGFFEKAKLILESHNINYIREKLLKISYDTGNIITYTFINSILYTNETAELHYCASELLCMPLCHIEGAYESALFHARKAIELDPEDISYKEYILFFSRLPKKIISDDEIIKYARDVLEEIPDNKAALDVLNIKRY